VPSAETLLVFSAAALALIVVPGPAVLYIVAQSIDRGRLAGVVSALGVATGGLVHVTAATIGLSSLLVSSATAFTIVKYAGAAYLIVLGIQKLREKPEESGIGAGTASPSLRRVFAQGVVVNVLNPKTALFFLALLPQFVDVDRGVVWVQMLALGLTFILLGICSDGAYALLAARAGGWLRASTGFGRAQRYVTGGVYLSLGAAAALTGSRSES
jgi:threonine/homoserine/homoserine lactone efflux protein